MTQTMIKLFVQLFSVLLILWPNFNVAKQNIINHLPGYPDKLPFHLETGYIGVGEMEEVQLFYYFIESEGDPKRDPLFLWLTGGPGCSALSGLVLEIGPLKLNISSLQMEVPKFQLNPYSWTKVASIVFVDAPVGTGFSYATTFGGYYSNDITQSSHIYDFLRKWLVDHGHYKDNPIYICGDSYGGKIVPIVLHNIINGNEVGMTPKINFKGYILGNPVTTTVDVTTTTKYECASRMSLIPDELYESSKRSCNGTYEDVDAHYVKCQKVVQAISYNLKPLQVVHVLEPKCVTPQTSCRDASYELLISWANNMKVQEAFQIREGTKSEWIRCNTSVAYASNVESTESYHQNFAKKSMNALVYSGDQDLLVTYVGTLLWIKNLNVSTTDDWRPWFVAGQVAGYTTKSSNGHYNLTFATVKGAGHTAPEYKSRECLTMITKWLAMSPL